MMEICSRTSRKPPRIQVRMLWLLSATWSRYEVFVIQRISLIKMFL